MDTSRARLVAALAIVAAACSDGRPGTSNVAGHAASESQLELAPPWKAPPASTAGSWCADCHQEIVESYARSGMARMLGPVDPAEFEGLQPTADVPAGLSYHYELDDNGAPRIVETRLDGSPHRLEASIEYAIGAGEHDRAYVARIGSMEWFSPLEVISAEGGRHTALAPGHMAAPGERFKVSITPECLGCHTDQLPPKKFPLNLHLGERWEPQGLTCAGCHGATERHATWQQAELAGEEPVGRDPILRPSQLDREARMSVCAACHLEGDARIAFDGRFGIPRPGRDLLDQRAVFVGKDLGQDVGFVSHVERLVQSACYLESETLDCTTCHDPHRTLHEEPERQRVRAACLACHTSDGAAAVSASASACSRPDPLPERDGDCASCHMRKTPTYDVADVEIHDHFIRTHPGPPSPPRKPRTQESPAGDWERFTWPGVEEPESVEDPGLWMMALAHRGHSERAYDLLDVAPGRWASQLTMYHHTRGSLLEAAGRVVEAQSAYEEALTIEPGFPPSAINLALLFGMSGDLERGLAMLDDVLAHHPEAVNALRNRAGLKAEGGDFRGFATDLARAFELQPDPEVADILARFHRNMGDGAGAAEWDRRGAALRP